MKNLLIFAVVGMGLYQGWQWYRSWAGVEPLYAGPYVAVYGRDSCGWTQGMLKELKAANVNYRYFVVDEQPIADLLHPRMEASGISIQRYDLPVVDINGHLSIRPDPPEVIAQYNEAP